MQFHCEHMDLTRQLGIGLQFQLLRLKIMVCLSLLELRLPVLSDHHERRKEDCLERHDEGQRGPRAFLQEQHPDGEYRCVKPDEVHRPGERGDSIGQPRLEIPVSSFGLLDHHWMVGALAAQELTWDQLRVAPGRNSVVIGHCWRPFAAYRKRRPCAQSIRG